MKDQSWLEFRGECAAYLSTLNIGSLRSYAREVGVAKPTTKKKKCLTDEILAIFAGDLRPVPRTSLGAPVKESGVDITPIKEEVERIRLQCYSNATGIPIEELRATMFADSVLQEPAADNTFDFKKELQRLRESGEVVFRVADSVGRAEKEKRIRETQIFVGQLETVEGIQTLLPIDGTSQPQILVPQELSADLLRDGDVVSCYAQKSLTTMVAREILTVNDRMKDDLKRCDFETTDSIAPTKKIKLYGKNGSLAMKYADWLLPLGKGQRGIIVSAPKCGKTTLLLDFVDSALENDHDLKVMALLVEQPFETVGEYRKLLRRDNVACVSYEDDPDKQVLAARLILKRAKRFAECGRNVLLVVDSLNALADAFNNTEESVGGKLLPGGLEQKTLQFMKGYFGSARNLFGSGSLTILGTVSTQTGIPSDNLLSSELSKLAGYELHLDETLAAKRKYPAIDFYASQAKQVELLFSETELSTERTARGWLDETDCAQNLRDRLDASDCFETFAEAVKNEEIKR